MLRIAIAFSALLAATAAPAEKRVALVIGNAAYAKLQPLNNPILDATRMATILARHGFDVLSCDDKAPGCFDLDREEMTDVLEDFEEMASGADVAFVFYAGHGMQTEDGNVLAPVNMELDCDTLDPKRAVLLDNVMESLADAREKIVIVDACRNNPFQAEQCAQRGGRPLSFTNFAVPESGENFLILTSTKPGQVAQDGVPGQHSPFAENLFKVMEEEPGSRFDQMFNRTVKLVIEKTKAARATQVPETLARGAAPEACLRGHDCFIDPAAALLRQEVDQLRAENERGQEYEEIATIVLRSAGYQSIDDIPEAERASVFEGILDAARAVGERGDTAGDRALAALKAGDESAAERLFEEEAAERDRAMAGERQRAAESYRHLAALARPKDVAKAARYFGEAVERDTGDYRTWMDYAYTSRDSGNTSEALRAFREASTLARDTGDRSERIWAAFGEGDIVRDRGRLTLALKLYTAAKNIAEEQLQATPDDLDTLRDLAVSNNKIGDVLRDLGESTAALESFEADLAITRRLVDVDPQNQGWRRDLAVSYEKVGNIHYDQDSLALARESYEASFAITNELATAVDPANKQWKRDLATAYEKLGNVSLANDDYDLALEQYQASLELVLELTAADPNNTEWQRDLSVKHHKIGTVHVDRGELEEAQEAFEADLEIAVRLADSDPENATWQRDAAVSFGRVGDTQRDLGDAAGALASYEASLAIRVKLAEGEPENVDWQRYLSINYDKIAELQLESGDTEGAAASYLASLDVAAKLAARNPSNETWQWDLAISHGNVGKTRLSLGDAKGALEAYEASLAVRSKLLEGEPENTEWLRLLSINHDKVAEIQLELGDAEGAAASYLASLEVAERLAAANPSNKTWQWDLFISYLNMGKHSSKPVENLEKATQLIERLDAEGMLTDSQLEWVEIARTRLADARKASTGG
jgi:tetratricopeptide (TPR) repeat protein